MASSRPKQAGALKSGRTLDKASQKNRSGADDVRVFSKSPIAKDATTSNIGKAFASPIYKPGDSTTQRQGQPQVDPYSLSDLDDDHGAGTPGSAQVRKRKRVHAHIEQPSAKARPSVPKVRIPTLLKAPEIVARKADKIPKAAIKRAATSGSTTSAQSSPTRLPAVAPQLATPQRSKPRLIDALAAQRDADQDSDSDVEASIATRSFQKQPRDIDDEIRSLLLPSTHTSQEGRSPAKPYTPRTTDNKTKSTRIKYTYSQASRNKVQPPNHPGRVATILEEPESDSILSSPLGPAPDPFDVSDTSDVEEDKRLEIKSIHELRRAGANNRFSDELEDLLSRIGVPSAKPSTLRRNALLELSQKLQRKEFAGQFRDHADRDTIAMSVGDDVDVVSGFALSAVLVQFLSDQPAPHLLHKLAVEGIGLLLGRLLLIFDDVEDIASRKQTNLSRHSRHAVAELKAYLLRMDIWPEQPETFLAPRTIALKLLDLLYQSSTWEESSMISAACLDDVSQAASALLQEIGMSSHRNLEFSLMVSIMEAQSNVAREMDQEVIWLRRQSSNARQSLQWTLRTWHKLEPRTRLATLKMAINATNTNDGASAFDSNGLLSDILICINSEIIAACKAVEQHHLDNLEYESLLLVLGVMINIMEHCPRARSSVESRPIDALAILYADNRLAMSEADSEEKSKLSVAFGYLAVLLGYLSLSEPGLSIVRSIASGQGMRKLLGSIREFIDVYKNVESKIHGLEGLVSELQTQLV